jgi:mannose/fructose/N-acetylgalactosamine-specific phosphotransferase system component IIC
MAWTQLLVAGIFGGLLALERRAFLQAMLSRPLVAATLMGALLDDLQAGLFIGMLLELFHLGSASLGAALPENDTLAATGAAAAAAALSASGAESSPTTWSLSILLFVSLGRIGLRAERLLDRYSIRLSHTAVASAERGHLTRAVRQNLWGMWPHFLLFGALTALCYAIGSLLGPHLDLLPPKLSRGLAWAFPAMGSVAAAIAARGSHAKRAGLYGGVAAVLVASGAALILLREGA